MRRVYEVKGIGMWKQGKKKLDVDHRFIVQVSTTCDARNAIQRAHDLARNAIPDKNEGRPWVWVDFDAIEVKYLHMIDN